MDTFSKLVSKIFKKKAKEKKYGKSKSDIDSAIDDLFERSKRKCADDENRRVKEKDGLR